MTYICPLLHLEEISDCKEPKKSQMYRYLRQISYTPIQITDSMSAVAEQIIDMGILTKRVMTTVSISLPQSYTAATALLESEV